MALDRVQVLKQEDAAGGGDPLDDVDFLNAPIEPQEDAIEAAGLYVQSPTAHDETVLITRDPSGRLTFKDNDHPSPVTLTTLLSTGGNTLHANTVSISIPMGAESASGVVTGLPAAPTIIVPAAGRDITSTVVDTDYSYILFVTAYQAGGFTYDVRVYDDGELDSWPGPAAVTVKFDYFWSE